jgi:hypothetical protein
MGVIHLLKDFESLLYEDIVRRKKTTPFLIFVSFILAFAVSRLFVVFFPTKNLIIRDYHIHHFYFGIILLTIACWIGLVSNRVRLHRLAAIMYGVGMGLIVDEFGLFLTCATIWKECDYWARISYDAFVVVAGVFFMIIYFEPFWRRMKRPVTKVIYKILCLFTDR